MKKHLSYSNGISLLIVMILISVGGNNLYARENQKKSIQKNDTEILSAYKKEVAASIEKVLQKPKLKSVLVTDPLLAADSLILVELYNSTDGANWSNNNDWLTGPVSSWDGITVVSNRVTEIELQKNNLSGSIPSSLGNLTSLEILNLDTNQITGAIPTQLGNLSNLQFLHLDGNNLTGPIPVELGDLTALTLLYLSDNQLGGTIPTQLANLANLRWLDLSENQLTGSVPVQLGSLTTLEFLDLGSNLLTGNLPTELGQLTNMIWMDLRSNLFSGSIPNLVGLPALEMLYINSNNLTDTIPAYLGSLPSLRWLNLGQNQLTGNIPVELGAVSTLELLILSDNDLTGSIPIELGALTNILLLYLNGNGLTGEIPSELGNLLKLIWFDLANNQLSGSIPIEFGGLTNLQFLDLERNELTGTIPAELGNLTKLIWMILSSNQLTGSIPATLDQLSNLTLLYLNDNRLTGAVPGTLGQLIKLKWLDFDSNQLDVLPDLSALDSLSEFTVSNNKFTFEDLEYNMNINDTVIFVYSPQDSIGISETFTKNEGETFSDTITTGGTQNSYQWYKDGVLLVSQITDTLEINNLTVSDAGNYYCKVTNALVPELTLTSREITLLMNYCINITFGTGWNIFSSPVMPVVPDMGTIFQPFIDNESLIKIQDEEGNSLEDLGIYGGWDSNLGDIALTEGYKVKMSNPNSVEICGPTVKYPYSIPLKTGWNIISYPQTTAFDGLEVVQQLIDRDVLIKVQDETGSSIEDLGIYGEWKNDIGNFLAGEGFKVKVSAADTLWIFNSYPKSSNIQPDLITATHFQPAFEGNGVDHMNIYLVNLDGSGIMEGDEIGIFDGNICVGATKINKQNSSYINLIASAADGNLENANGFGNGRDIILKLYRNGKEYPMSLQPVNNASLRFEKNGSVIAMANTDLTTGIEITGNESDINCYPNPFYESINIETNLQNEDYLNVEIYDMYSRKIRQLHSGKAVGAIKLQWDGNDERGNKVASGVYLLRVNKTWKKVMLSAN